MSRTKHVGVWGSFGTGRQSLCGAASWTYKELGAGEIEKGGALQGQRGVGRKLRVPGLKPRRGRGALLSGRSCIQMHSSRTSGLPFTSSAIPASVCDMDTGNAPPSSQNTENPLRISGKSCCTYPKRMRFSSCEIKQMAMFAILSGSLVNKTWWVLHGVKLNAVHFKSSCRLGLKNGLLANKWMFGKTKNTRVHWLGISLSYERASDGTWKWTEALSPEQQTMQFWGQDEVFSQRRLVMLYYALLYIAEGCYDCNTHQGGKILKLRCWCRLGLLPLSLRKELPQSSASRGDDEGPD